MSMTSLHVVWSGHIRWTNTCLHALREWRQGLPGSAGAALLQPVRVCGVSMYVDEDVDFYRRLS